MHLLYDKDRKQGLRKLRWDFNGTTDGVHMMAFPNLVDMLILDFQQLDLSPLEWTPFL